MPETIAVCTKTKPQSVHPWRCVRAADHDGGCTWPIESEHYNLPLDGYSAEWLASEVRMLLSRLQTMKRDHAASRASLDQRHGVLMHGLVELAPANSTRKNVPTAAVQELWQKARG